VLFLTWAPPVVRDRKKRSSSFPILVIEEETRTVDIEILRFSPTLEMLRAELLYKGMGIEPTVGYVGMI
jgi:hypothetical protein